MFPTQEKREVCYQLFGVSCVTSYKFKLIILVLHLKKCKFDNYLCSIQLGTEEKIPKAMVYDKWMGICLNKGSLDDLMNLGNFKKEVNGLKFAALAAGTLETVSQNKLV